LRRAYLVDRFADVNNQFPNETAEALLDEAQCGYVATDLQGTIITVNRTLLSWTGYELGSLLAVKKVHELLTTPGRIYFETHIFPLLQMQGYVREVAFDLVRSGGSPLPVLLNCIQKDTQDGRAGSIRIVVFDASDRRKYERELLRAKRLADEAAQIQSAAREDAERANRAKDDFLALVSHELRTPLGVILGWTQVLRKKGPADEPMEHALSVIERNTRAQVRLVDDLLDMGRIISGKLRLDVQRVELANVIEAALETAEPAAAARGVRIQKILDPAVVVSGDPGRLQQVFWNLLSNAVKFTGKDGFVRVVMERVDSHVQINVIDSGQGMSADFIAHAFERFRQSDSAITRRTGGLGLGLSLVKYIVEMHGGAIEARSEGEGCGSTFTVRLPVTVISQTEKQPRMHPQALLAAIRAPVISISLVGIRVVIAEDDRDARELLWHTLDERGAEVVATGSASEALAAVERIHPHVLVSDIGLPGEDGYELIRKVRMLGDGLGSVAAIALTALSRLEDRTSALLAGYQIHLAKPVDARELIVTVASLAGRIKPAI
jgi:PAS domain S-box-containing protein